MPQAGALMVAQSIKRHRRKGRGRAIGREGDSLWKRRTIYKRKPDKRKMEPHISVRPHSLFFVLHRASQTTRRGGDSSCRFHSHDYLT